MTRRPTFILVVALVVFASPAFATVIVTSPAAFLAQAAPGYYLEQFNCWSYGNPYGGVPSYGSPVVNGYSWIATASTGGIFSLSGALSNTNSFDLLRITFTGSPVTAVGGYFFSTDLMGGSIPQDITVTLNDGSTITLSGAGFVGFLSPVPIAYLETDGIDLPPGEDHENWPAVDDLYVGSVRSVGPAVPEPGTLLLLGGGVTGLALRRRRRS
jgi:hypothetical protein